MSTPYQRNPDDPLTLVPFDQALLNAVASAASNSPRRRSIVRLHDHGESVQRMLNAMEPDSYVPPHRHPEPGKAESVVALRGSALVVRFEDDGTPIEGVVVSADGAVKGVEVPAGAWHSVVALRPGTVLFEVNKGPYDQATHKEFAPWASPEDDREAGLAFIAQMRGHFEPLFPEIAALNRIEAEEDEIC